MAKRPTILFDLAAALFFCLLGFLFFPSRVFASVKEGVVINEIAWMGTEKTASDEWIELYNNANYGINLSGWSLKAQDSFQITLKGTIPAKGFYLLERTDDQAVPKIFADLIFKGSLPNKGLKISLYNKEGSVIDDADCSNGWLGGDNSSKQTMERTAGQNNPPAGSWQTSLLPGGTPKAGNSPGKKPTEAKKQNENKDPVINSAAAIGQTVPNTDAGEQIKAVGTVGRESILFSFGLAIFSGTIIIFLKRNLKQIN